MNNPKPQEWKSEELSQGRIIDYKAFNFVDGRYDRTKRNLMLQFRGSSNQRIIDVQKSLQSGQVVIWDKLNDGKESYEQVKRE